MKLKTLLMAFVLSISSISAFATTVATTPVSIYSSSFSNILLGTIQLTSQSDVSGSIDYLGAFSSGGFAFSFVPVNVSNNTFGFTTTSGNTFSFSNLNSGSYNIFASGNLLSPTPGKISLGYGSLYASYTVTAVPEPKTSGMFLAGLGLIGFIASRRKSSI